MTESIPQLRTPHADPGTGQVSIGQPVSRIDGRAKVTGAAHYAAEHHPRDLCHGVVVNSTIAKGRIVGFELEAARAVPGLLAIITHEDRPKMRWLWLLYKDMTAPGGRPFRPLYDARILYNGQPVALVVADTFEAATCAASLVQVRYAEEAHETNLMMNLHRGHTPRGFKAGYRRPPREKGDANAAFAAAPVKIAADFYAGVEHNNPMELFASTVIRDTDGHFTVYDKTQSPRNSRCYISRVFGIGKKDVTVRNPYVGGAFGAGLRPQYQLALAVMAALKLNRSVRVVLTRPQMFTFGHRPETFQRLRLAADTNGKLRAIIHEAIAETSRFEDYKELVVNWSGQLYACDNIRLGYQLVSLDQYSPIDMRAPGAAHGVHALEVAMDELAHELKMDPLALRLTNYAERDPIKGRPFSSKALRACYEQGAARFGWANRPLAPRSMRDGDELIGWGMATGTWDAMQVVARANAVFHADGRLIVSSAASDIGTGTYTVMATIAAATMGLPLERVTFQLGDSTLPFALVEGGSSHVTTVGSAVEGACERLKKRLFRRARRMNGSPFARHRFADVEFKNGCIVDKARPDARVPLADVLNDTGERRVEASYWLLPCLLDQQLKYVCATHSAVFCEVRVDETLGTVRVTRVVSAVAAGRIINAKTARSQISGAVVWGISQALHEETLSDDRFGRFMNHSIADYHISVNADIHDIDVIFVEEDDRIVSRLGAKGVGEIGMVGVSAAVCNAIFHATGRRIYSTPMTPDKVMTPP